MHKINEMPKGARPSSERPKRLHLGGFNQVHTGWINTDVTMHIWVARVPGVAWALHKLGRISGPRYEDHRRGVFRRVRYLNATRRFPFPEASMEAVFASHLLEHLPPAKALIAVKEAHRVLRPGGILRIAVPDLDLHVREYQPDAPDDFIDFAYGYGEGGHQAHHFAYNEMLLSRLLKSAGFATVYRCQFRQGQCPDVDRLDNRPRSLFMEARKS